jgi:hypothetical protein
MELSAIGYRHRPDGRNPKDTTGIPSVRVPLPRS